MFLSLLDMSSRDRKSSGRNRKVKCVGAATQRKTAEKEPANRLQRYSLQTWLSFFLYQWLLIVLFHFLCALEWICVQYLIC